MSNRKYLPKEEKETNQTNARGKKALGRPECHAATPQLSK